MASVTVVIPTIAKPVVLDAIKSVLNQKTEHEILLRPVIDGSSFYDSFFNLLFKKIDNWKEIFDDTINLVDNTGANGFYGHRIYAAMSFLVNTDYIMYLDEDNFFQEDHVETMINTARKYDWDWVYSLRNIVDSTGQFLCQDNCESLGKWYAFFNNQVHHVDTSCYLIKTDAIRRIGQVWFHGWGGDRVFYANMSHHFKNYGCTGKYTVNYRLDGNPNSVTEEFFKQGNAEMEKRYGKKFPWSSI